MGLGKLARSDQRPLSELLSRTDLEEVGRFLRKAIK